MNFQEFKLPLFYGLILTLLVILVIYLYNKITDNQDYTKLKYTLVSVITFLVTTLMAYGYDKLIGLPNPLLIMSQSTSNSDLIPDATDVQSGASHAITKTVSVPEDLAANTTVNPVDPTHVDPSINMDDIHTGQAPF